MKRSLFALLLTLLLLLTVLRLGAQDETVLSDIRKRLRTPGIDARHDHDRFLFVGEILALGPVFQGVCKSGVVQSVDYGVGDILLGDPPDSVVHTGYINCTRQPLPSPPYTLRAKVIVYCFHNMRSLHCLVPVAFNESRLKKIKSWIAAMPAATNLLAPPADPE
jgi:hypothetical protein